MHMCGEATKKLTISFLADPKTILSFWIIILIQNL